MAHEINDRDTDILQCDPEAYGPDINESETDGLLQNIHKMAKCYVTSRSWSSSTISMQGT